MEITDERYCNCSHKADDHNALSLACYVCNCKKWQAAGSISATVDYDQLLAVDAWRCSNCGAHTYDSHRFEIPTFCCRCGKKFSEYDYNEKSKRLINLFPQPDSRKPVNMIWANEAGVSVYVYEAEHDRRVIEIHGVVSDRETVLATATIERHNRNRLAEALEYF